MEGAVTEEERALAGLTEVRDSELEKRVTRSNFRMPVEMKLADTRALEHYPTFAPATEGSGGFDLRAMLDEPLVLEPGQVELVGSGISVWIKMMDLAGYILPRSGMGHKYGIVLGNLVGFIDSDYQGELKVSLWNRSNEAYTVQPGERIAQFVVAPITPVSFSLVDNFSNETPRGEGGFGHTGKK